MSNSPIPKAKITANHMMVGLFLVGLALPAAIALPGPLFRQNVSVENRFAARWPDLSALLAGRAGRQAVETALNDRIGGRAALVGLRGAIGYDLFGGSPSRRVVTGRGGWLFLTDRGSIEDHRRRLVLPDALLTAIAGRLTQRQADLAAQGIRYGMVITPDKHSIYPDYLPDHLAPGAGRTRLDQVIQTVAARGLLLDLRPALTSAREREGDGLYFRLDTHWTALGAWYGANAVLDWLGRPALPRPPLPREHRSRTDLPPMIGRTIAEENYPIAWTGPCGAQAQSFHADGRLAQEGDDAAAPPPITITTCPGQDGTLLLFRDSFSNALLPYFAERFGRVIAVRAYPTDRQIADFVAQHRPTHVLEQRVERNLDIQWGQ